MSYPPPPALPTAKRIPENQPYVVRNSAPKRLLQFGALGLLVLLFVGCPMGFAAAEGGAVVLLVMLVFLLFVFGLIGFQMWLITSGGPVLALNPDGVWIKTRPTRGQAIFLPWYAVEQVYRRRWGVEKMVCVKPKDPRTDANLGAFTAVESSMQKLFFGTGFTAPLTFADRSENEIMGAIAHYAAGRAYLR